MNKKQSEKITEFEREGALWSNERTMLSHLRTGFAAVVLGLAILKLFEPSQNATYGGGTFIFLGAVFILIGIFSYYRRNRKIIKY